MLEYTLDTNEQFKALKTVINTIVDILPSGPRSFSFNPEGIFFEAMDQGSIFIYASIKKDFFTKYECENDLLELRLDPDELKKCFPEKLHQKESLSCSFSNINRFVVKYTSEIEGAMKREYELPLHNPDDDEEKRNIADVIKSIPLSAFIRLSPTNFSKILTDCKVNKDQNETNHLNIMAHEELATFEINRGSDKMSAYVYLPLNGDAKFDEESVRAAYDGTYLVNLKKIDGQAQEVTLEYGNDKPLRMNFLLNEHFQFIYVMAPLVEEDEEEDDKEDDD